MVTVCWSCSDSRMVLANVNESLIAYSKNSSRTGCNNSLTVFGPEQCPVYLKLPWRGKISQKFEQQVKRSVSQCYNSVAMRVIFTTHKLLPSGQKDVLPTKKLNNVIYEFQCRCDARYVGRTSLRLEDRIKQHILLALRNNLETGRTQPSCTCINLTRMPAQSDSSIGQHLLNNSECAQDYHAEWVQIVAHARTEAYLRVLEATFIHKRAPVLCKQK